MAPATKAANRKDVTTGTGLVKFEHRHFAKVAAIIAAMNGDPGIVYSKRQIAILFADALEGTNPNFNYNRFMAATKSA